jgi:hypothetical protein
MMRCIMLIILVVIMATCTYQPRRHWMPLQYAGGEQLALA